MDKRYQVFVSSTYTDLIDERKEATQAILKCNCFPAGMELFPASNTTQWNVIKKVIDDSDFYLLILAGRYGSLGTNDNKKKIGYTEMEFDYALSKGKPILAMLHRFPDTLPSKFTEKNEANRKRLEKFREKAQTGRMVAYWENKDQLKAEIITSLYRMMASTPEAIGWVKANTISISDDAKTNDILTIKTIMSNGNNDDIIKCFDKYQYTLASKCFQDESFVKEYIKLISIQQPEKVISSAIYFLPHNLDDATKNYLINAIDIKTLFFSQCKNGIIQDTPMAGKIISLLTKLNVFLVEYLEPIFMYLKGENFENIKYLCINYITRNQFSYNFNQIKIKNELNEYFLLELCNPNKHLTIDDLVSLFVSTCTNGEEYAFEKIYELFNTNEKKIQMEIVDSIFENIGSDVWLVTPKIQRKFISMCEEVFSWNDDAYTHKLLLYCLFCRTYDIFTVDEVYKMLDRFNDDVFYLFFWGLGYGEFGYGTEESFDLDEQEKERASAIIKSRNHTREAKLLEHLNKN